MTDLSGIQHALGDALSSLGLGGLSQHTRLLRLHTPLGPDVLLAERVTIHEGLVPSSGPAAMPTQAACHIDLLALSPRADLRAADLLGQPALLELQTASAGARWRPFHGHITRFECLGADGGLARYRLHIEPWLSLLAHRTDAWVFQDQSVLDITEAMFADYAAQGALQPAWRIDVADRAAFPRRSLCVQFHETDLAFLSRLWAEEGLFAWFEHSGQPDEPATLGCHTLVLADHNGAFQPNAQARIRFTQASATLPEDSLSQWHGMRRLGPTQLHTASWDYRQVDNHRASLQADAAHGQPMALTHTDQPGAYAYEHGEQAQRRARLQRQALDAERKQFTGAGTVRTLAPGTTFTLLDHAEHDADRRAQGDDAARFAVLHVVHRARNNLRADSLAGLQHTLTQALGHAPHDSPIANDSDEALYEARLIAQRAGVPVRPTLRGAQGRLAHAKPTASGTQTALVVGLDAPVHTDRDGRIKVQFHWQRGTQASHRLSHPSPAQDTDNAPASDASGTWVRVAQSWAGDNWGGVFIPRLGQEVVIAFVDGDIDRPVVIGAAYNGQGQGNAPANAMAGGAAQSTANAPAWFPGSERQGEHMGHAHAATLSGLHTQSLDSSQAGGGGHNQLVMDDTPGQGRVLLHTTQQQTWLQLGHLLQQHGNQRLTPRGHGLELHTQAQGALRAGAGLHLSTHARAQGTAGTAQPLDTREAQHQLHSHTELLHALHANAQTHRAGLPAEAAAEQLPARQALDAALSSLQSTQAQDHGRIATTGRPDLVFSAAADIHSATPAHTLIATGLHLTLTTGQDANLMAQRHQAWAAKDGISLFTRGQAKNSQRAVQDTGIQLHAASGNVNVQAQSGPFTLTAQQAIDLQSASADIVVTAPERIVLNGGGSYLKIEGDDIEIGTSGPARFGASVKELAGGSGASGAGPTLNKAQELFDEQFVLTDKDTAIALSGTPYRIENSKGHIVATGVTDAHGRTARVTSAKADTLKVFWGR